MSAQLSRETMASTQLDSDCLRARATGDDPSSLVRQLQDQLGTGPHALVAAFVTPTVDRPAIARLLHEGFPDCIAIGCTTAGEIGLGGYVDGGAVAFAFGGAAFHAVHTVFDDVLKPSIAEVHLQVQTLMRRLAATGRPTTAGNTFALLLIDGLSLAEEALTSMVSNVLGDIPLAGGSAGDGLAFGCSHVFANGRALAHGAVLVLVQTELPFEVFKTQHFAAGERRMVVTAAHCPTRTVHEIDGLPAAEEFARMHDTTVDKLGPEFFATHPLLVRVGGGEYVRSIQKMGADGSLTFFCAIEEGLVLRDARGRELARDLAETVDRLDRSLGGLQLTITFDCILRRLECERMRSLAAVSSLLERGRCLGFSTYGEQLRGIHVNQTLTGVAIGTRSRA